VFDPLLRLYAVTWMDGAAKIHCKIDKRATQVLAHAQLRGARIGVLAIA